MIRPLARGNTLAGIRRARRCLPVGLATELRLTLCFLLVRFNGEPLHVAWMIGAPAFQGDDVVDLIAWTR